MVGSHNFARGLHSKRKGIKNDIAVATTRAIMTYIALLHTRVVVKSRRRKRQIDNLVNIDESTKSGTRMNSSLVAKDIYSSDK